MKEINRTGWVNSGLNDVESVAAHTWGVAYLCLVLCPKELDREKVLSMSLVHDLGEAIIGDITPDDGVPRSEKYDLELNAINELTNDLEISDEVILLWKEYEENFTPEAKFVKACDKLDMALQASIYQNKYKSFNPEEFITSALKKIDDENLKILALNTVNGKNPN